MKKIGVLAAVLSMAFLCVGGASAEMYVEGYVGGSFASNLGQTINMHELQSGAAGQANYHFNYAGEVDNPFVIGGIKVGTWFVKEGFAGWSGYPEWCKYLGFYADFGYQKLNLNRQRLSGTDFFSFNPPGTAASVVTDVGQINSSGTVATWAFMFAGRYGFFPDSEVPFGRLQPYVAVGPAVMFSSMKPKLFTNAATAGAGLGAGNIDLTMSPGNQGSVDIALAADAGIRYMALKNVSFDISFKYRYAQPTYQFAGQNAIDAVPARFTLNPSLNLYSFQAGVAYHF